MVPFGILFGVVLRMFCRPLIKKDLKKGKFTDDATEMFTLTCWVVN